MNRNRAALTIAMIALLCACEDEVDRVDRGETGGQAAGEVLGGTISDDMIALDQLTSTSPPAESAESAEGAEDLEAAEEDEDG